MADPIPSHYATEFNTNWMHRTQQMVSRFDGYVEDHSFSGERKRFDRINKQTSVERTERKAPTPVKDLDTDSRWTYRRTFDLANVLAEEDARNLAPLVLPTSDIVRTHGYAYQRDSDAVVLQAAIGNVMTGELGTTPTALPAGQKIAASASGLTLAKLLAAREICMGNELIDDPAAWVIAIGPKQMTDLLNDTKVQSADYNTVKALASGTVDMWMGFKFIVTNQLAIATSVRSCVAWTKGSIKRVKGGMRTTIDRLPERSNATQIYSMYDLSAARVYDEGVIQIDCTES